MEGKQKKNNILMISIISVAALIAAVSGAMFFINFFGIDTGVATPDETTAPTTVEVTDPEPTDMTTPDGEIFDQFQDWNELKAINEEIVGWITIPHTVVHYPVLFHEGDDGESQYYLHRNYDKSYLNAGSIFIDYRCKDVVNSKNVITHGHHMASGAMYAALIDYGKWSANLDQYKKAPTLFFNTPESNEQWIIFSVYKTNTLDSHGEFFNYLQGDFDSDAQFMNYIYNVKERSFFDVPVPINEDDQIITLSTCSYEYPEFRTVAVARKIRPGEGVKKYVDAATVNEDAVWPEVYYRSYGGTRPTITTFKTELSKGNIDWYDGEGVPSGNEWLPTLAGAKSFIVTFINYDGSIIETQVVKRGEDAVAPQDPKKPSDAYYDYIFRGWQLDFTDVDRNMTVAPKFEPVLRNR